MDSWPLLRSRQHSRSSIKRSSDDKDLGNTVESIDAGSVEGSWVFEVAKADVTQIASTTDVDDDAENEKDDDSEYLDSSKDELDFSIGENTEH